MPAEAVVFDELAVAFEVVEGAAGADTIFDEEAPAEVVCTVAVEPAAVVDAAVTVAPDDPLAEPVADPEPVAVDPPVR